MSVVQFLNLTGGVILTTLLHAFCGFLIATSITDSMHLVASIRNIMAADTTCSFTSLEVQTVAMILYVRLLLLFLIRKSVEYAQDKSTKLSQEYYQLALEQAQKDAQYYKAEMERLFFTTSQANEPEAEHDNDTDNDADDGSATSHAKD
jgi:hypothetical protein